MKSEKGFSLLEVTVAVAIIGILAVAFIAAMIGASRAIFIADEKDTARSLSGTEMEYVKSQKYEDFPTSVPWSYELPLGSPPSWDLGHSLSEEYEDAGYSVVVVGDAIDVNGDSNPDSGILKITITVYHLEKPQPIITIEDYKVDR